MYKILQIYIIRVILFNILLIFSILISFSSIIRLLDELRNVGRCSFFISDIILHAMLSIPKDLESFFPISILLGGLLGLSVLEVRSELIIMQVFGLSKLQITVLIIKACIPVLLCNVIFNEWLLPYSQKMSYIYQQYDQFNTYLFPERNKNLWLIDNNCVVSIQHMLTTHELLGVNLYYFTQSKQLKSILYVERATYQSKCWDLLNVIELDFSNINKIIGKNIQNCKWITTLTPSMLFLITTHPRMLSISKLFYCIDFFKKNGQNCKYYQLIFWNKIFAPVIDVTMIIIALSCSFGPFQRKKTSVRLFIGSIIGFIFYILHQLFGTFSIKYNIFPWVGVIIPIILFLLISVLISWKYS